MNFLIGMIVGIIAGNISSFIGAYVLMCYIKRKQDKENRL